MLKQTPPLQRYGAAIAFPIIALLLMLGLDPFLELSQASFLLFFGAITLSAWYGGRSPGIVTTVLSAMFATYFFLGTQYSWSLTLASGLRLLFFILQGLLISVLVGALRLTQAQAYKSVHQLQTTEAEIRVLNQSLQQRLDELHSSQERLRAANERFRLAASAVKCLIYDWDLKSDRVERTDGLTRLFGYALEAVEPTAQWWANRIHPDDLKAVHSQAQAVLAQEDFFSAEYRILNQANQYVYVLDCCLVAARDAEGKPARIVGSTTDISDRKRAELQLQESQQFIQQVADSLPGTLYVYDMVEHRNVYVNRQIGELLGYTPEQIQALGDQLFTHLLHPDDLATIDQQIERLNHAQAGEAIDYEYRMRHANGEWRWLWSRNTVSTHTAEGLAHQVVGTAHDITARKQTETELQQRELEFRALIENTPDIIARHDRELRYLYISPNIEQAVGVPAHKIIGKTAAQFGLTTPQAQCWYAALQRVFETGEQCAIEAEFPNPAGELRVYQAHFVPELKEGKTVKTVVSFSRDITEYKQATDSLRQSEERLRLATEAAQMGTWDVDLTTGKSIWSEQHFTVLGYTPNPTGEANKAMWLSRIHPDDRDSVFQAWQQAKLEHQLYRTEYRVIRADDGKVAWIRALGSFTYHSSGQAVRSIGILFDITERKQIEESLQDSEERLNTIANNVPSIVWMADPKGTIVWTSDAWYVYTGLTPEQNAHDWQQVLHPDDRERCLAQWQQALNRGEPYEIEVRNRRKDGEYRWFLTQAIPMRNEVGRVTAWFGSTTDIHGQKITEVALRENMAVLSTINQATPILIYVKDQQGRLLMVNPATVGVIGKPETDIIGKTVRDFLSPVTAEPIVENDRHVMETGQVEVYEETIVTPDGERIFLSTKSPYRDDQGRVIGLIGVSTDITERKQAEVEREELLQREQAAREAAERANRIKDEFLSILSHELRSPLNPILGWSKLLQAKKLNETKTKEALLAIERNAKLQTQLIDDLLDIAKILRGKLILNQAPVNLASVVSAALEVVSATAEAKSISLQSTLADTVLVKGDNARLHQIIWNLLSNAIKFTPNGGRVEVQLEQKDNAAHMSVTDTGKGISPDFLPYIFESFRQEDTSITRKHGGLGLGLSIVKYLVDAHGGTIVANSTGEGQGAIFTVTLPLLEGKTNVPPDDLPSTISVDLTGIKVLGVDDNEDARELLASLLSGYGAEVEVAASGEEALFLLDRFAPQVLVCDISMPDMDGYTLLQKIRSLPATQGGDVPAIALTAYARQEDYQRALECSFQRHMAKPLDPELLTALIAELAL